MSVKMMSKLKRIFDCEEVVIMRVKDIDGEKHIMGIIEELNKDYVRLYDNGEVSNALYENILDVKVIGA